MDELDTPVETAGGFDRRRFLKRSAVVGGALVWVAPAVQTLASPAFGATTGSASCSVSFSVTTITPHRPNPIVTCTTTTYPSQPQVCCDCINYFVVDQGFPVPVAAGICFFNGFCDPGAPSTTAPCA